MPVVDASVVVEFLGGGELFEAASAVMTAAHRPSIEEQLAEPSGAALWAPHLIDAEVGHVFRRHVSRGELDERTAAEALDDLARLPLVRSGHTGLLARAWELRSNVSFYDAIYVALAERIGAPLITVDARLARAAETYVDVRMLAAGLNPARRLRP